MMGRWATAHSTPQRASMPQVATDSAGRTTLLEFASGLAGQRLRLVLAEHYGTEPVTYGRAVVEVDGVQREVAFGGQSTVTVPPAGAVTSDPVDLAVAQGGQIKLWLYTLPGSCSKSPGLYGQKLSAPGDFCGQAFTPEPFTPPPMLQGYEDPQSGYAAMEVEAPEGGMAVAAFGDSITASGFWVNPLRERVSAQNPLATVLNCGISGNRLLRNTNMPVLSPAQVFGVAGLQRLSRDALELSGVKTLLLALGTNDISQPGGTPGISPPVEEVCTLEELLEGYRQVIAHCHEAGVKAVGCTITPFGGFANYNETTAALWRGANQWIRESGEFDGVVDFAASLCDPADDSRMLAAYDSGDHLHPNEAGGRAMAECVDLAMLL